MAKARLLDLIGLPPTLVELQRFLNQCEENPDDLHTCYRAEVDRLLASPHFGERWAAMWLDLARYADSQGYEKDLHRTAWPYRNWVIDAFNRDLPFDEFTVKQIAGDLLPKPTLDDVLATTFHRNTQTNTEGGTDDEEYRIAAILDRVNTTWTVWHATTFGCTQCHAHPYDPFTNEEYYQFLAFFNNTADHDVDHDGPTLKLPADKDAQSWESVFEQEQQRRRLREQLNQTGREIAGDVNDWQPIRPSQANASEGQLEINESHQVVAAGGTFPVGVTYEVTADARPLQAIRLEILHESDNPRDWPERGSVVSTFELDLVLPDGKQQSLKFSEVIADHLVGFDDPLESLRGSAQGFGGYPKLINSRWAVFLLKEPIQPPAGSSLVFRMHQRHSTTGGQSVHLRRFTLSSSVSSQWEQLTASPERVEMWKQHEQLTSAKHAWQGIEVPVLRSRGEHAARTTHTFVRGNWLDRDQQVTPHVPEQLHTLQPGKAGRLQLAHWLVSEDNPLTARVLANRLWAELFGIGIVETLEDFGSTGTPPAHPELLDHLAIKLQRQQQWHLKPFLRDLVLSATYCQSARSSAELQQRDPRNRLLARGPRTRLTAEMVRDQALKAAGLLTPKIGGPSVMPPQPESVWQAVYDNSQWETATGPDRFRRGIYTYWRRTSPYPSFMSFDAPSREVCSARRIPTNTPLQALVTLNDPVYVECSQRLAETAQTDGGDSPEAWIRWSYQTVTQQLPTETALAELAALYQTALEEYQVAHTDESATNLTPQTRALAIVTSTILNLDEAMTK